MTSNFEEVGYVYLPDFLNKENCKELTEGLFELVKNKQTKIDDQCPKSESIRDVEIFDSLLEQLLPHIEKETGKTLYPTYAYARLYAPGEKLEIHLDRPACEISLTLTIGFEGNVWPIYMGNSQKIEMQVGDAVLYKGCEVPHWRNEYSEGKWQAQVFLHYVDANGAHSKWKYDKRTKLNTTQNIVDISYYHMTNFLSKEACEKVIAQCEKSPMIDAKVACGTLVKKIRDAKRVELPIDRGISVALAGAALQANQTFWNYSITHTNQSEFLKYDIDGHYEGHVDAVNNPKNEETRKLTVLLFLNNDFEGGKLFLQTSDQKVYPPQDAGTILIFPSFMLHGVEPVTSGIRRSIVAWMVGPYFK